MNFTGFPGFPTTYRQDPPPRVEELPETGSETRRWLELGGASGVVPASSVHILPFV